MAILKQMEQPSKPLINNHLIEVREITAEDDEHTHREALTKEISKKA